MTTPLLLRHFILAAIFAIATLAQGAPTLWIIGDSTVRNGTPNQRGWGDPLVNEFDPASIHIVNRAIGGRSSRTFLTEGRWESVLAAIRPGDFVLMQFGHNDGGEFFKGDRPRASIKGIGDETETGTVETTGKEETVHTFGWYLRKYCKEAREKGASPIVVSPIPRNSRDTNGRIVRSGDSYALWAEQAARETNSHFIDFNSILAERYDELGEEATDALFDQPDHTHTNSAGAVFNAGILAHSIRTLQNCELGSHLLPADLWLPHIFSDHMVLQQGDAIPVWGRTTPGALVRATIAHHEATATSGEDGRFLLKLPAMATGGPETLTVSSEASTLSFTDVLIGEVWLCSGQSNMDFSLAPTEKRYFAGTRDWKKEIADGDQPEIRMFTAEWTLREEPQPDVGGSWKVATPETVGDFSAVAWFFARDLHEQLRVPIGLVTCAYGASTAEAWISHEKLASVPELTPLLDQFNRKKRDFRDDVPSQRKYGESLAKWEKSREGRAPKNPDPVQDQHNPCVLFNGMISPIAPYGIRGAIWYQGESNVATRELYPALQRSLIEDWRGQWKNDELPFYFVQLAGYKAPADRPSDSSLAAMREAQSTSLQIPHTGMAVTVDIGEEKDIHPRNKQDVGHRLARLALAGTYDQDIVCCGPLFRKQAIEGSRIRLHFDHAADRLIAMDGPLKHFAIAGSDAVFEWADATIDGDTVLVEADSISKPAYVRYGWADNPANANLFNSENLPAAPFRTDP